MKYDSKTILRYDSLLRVYYFNDAGIIMEDKDKEKVKDNNNLEKYKKCILKNIAMNPALTRTGIRERCKKEYTYIYRNDKR